MASATNSNVMHYSKRLFPIYLLLSDHMNVVSCLRVETDREMAEVQSMVAAAIRECKHNALGVCLRVEITNKRKWEEMH